MPSRSQKQIRHDIKRLDDVVDEHAPVYPEFAAIQPTVDASVVDVDAKWQAYQAAALASTKEIGERDTAAAILLSWTRSWRGVVIMRVPGAKENIREIPSDGSTVDHVVNQATDIKALIETSPAAAPFRESALAALGTKIEDAKREDKEAKLAVPAKQKAEEAFANATLAANTVLVEGSRIVSNVFGDKSHEYKRLVSKKRTKAEEEDDDDDDETENKT